MPRTYESIEKELHEVKAELARYKAAWKELKEDTKTVWLMPRDFDYHAKKHGIEEEK